MITFLFLRESTVFPLLWAALRRRPVVVLGCLPLFRPLRAVLTFVLRHLAARGLLLDEATAVPNMRAYREMPYLAEAHDIHARTEDWIRRHFHFEDAACLGPYADAYRYVTVNYLATMHVDLLVLDAIVGAYDVDGKNDGRPPARVVGMPSDMGALYAAFSSRMPAGIASRHRQLTALMLLPLAWSTNLLRSLVWIARRIRAHLAPPTQVFFAADAYGDLRDLRVFRETIDAKLPRLFVTGDYGDEARLERLYAPDPLVIDTHGRFTPAGAIRVAAEVAAHSLRLAWFCRRLSANHGQLVLRLAHEQAVTSGLLNLWHMKFWWRRDYTRAEHVLRTQLLRRAGVVSIGYPHAIPTGVVLHPLWRYMNYDVVYSCPALHARYRDTWPAHMQIRYAGSASFDAAAAARAAQPRPGDFAVFVALAVMEPEMLRAVTLLAETFPERTIHIKLKRSVHISDDNAAFYDSYFAHPNVVASTEEAPELLLKCRYAVSDISTVIQEAVQFDCVTFLMDVVSGQRAGFLRAFPELCVTSADELLARVRGVEDGTRPYDRASLADLTDLRGVPFSRALRQDLGLPEQA